MEERLQKIISRAGFASRRAGEELIQAGRVRVNGRIVTELGAKADPFADTIEVDGRRLIPESARYIVLHKPRNVVSTLSDPEGRPTVAELLHEAGTRLYPVGRLDFATSGVLLITNDGDFANGMLHPRGGVPKTYVVKTRGIMSPEDLDRWRNGIELEDGKTLPAEVRFLRREDDKSWFEVTLREGRNQQIRRMGEATGFPVMRLARLSFAGITSEGLRPGQWRSLTVDELLELRKQYGVPKRIRGAKVGAGGETHDARARRPRPARAEGRPVRAEGRPVRAEGRPAHREEGRPARAEGRPAHREEGRPTRAEGRPARAEGRPAQREESPRARPARNAPAAAPARARPQAKPERGGRPEFQRKDAKTQRRKKA